MVVVVLCPINPKSACVEINERKAEMAEKLEKLRQDANVKIKKMDSESAAGFIKSLGEAASRNIRNNLSRIFWCFESSGYKYRWWIYIWRGCYGS